MPLVEPEALFRLDAERIVEPALHEVNLDLSILEIQSVTFPFGHIFRAGEDGSGGSGGLDPCGERELVIEAEIGYAVVDIDFNTAPAIEHAVACQAALDDHAS